MEPKTNCFAYSNKEGHITCLALSELNCEKCHFFKTKEQYAQELSKERRK